MTHRSRFDCEELFRRLEDYVDRELSRDEAALVDQHLAECEACAMEYKFEKSFVSEVRKKLQHLETSPDLLKRISKALHDLPPTAVEDDESAGQ